MLTAARMASLFLCIADCKNIFYVCTDPSDIEVQGILMKLPYSHFQRKGTSSFPLCAETGHRAQRDSEASSRSGADEVTGDSAPPLCLSLAL